MTGPDLPPLCEDVGHEWKWSEALIGRSCHMCGVSYRMWEALTAGTEPVDQVIRRYRARLALYRHERKLTAAKLVEARAAIRRAAKRKIVLRDRLAMIDRTIAALEATTPDTTDPKD